jgi:fluoride exporter
MQTVEMAALRDEDVLLSDTLGSGPVPGRLAPWTAALLVAAGGALGALLRFGLTLLAPTVTTPTLVELPWTTLWVNLLGCLALGALSGALEVRPGRPWMQPLLGAGLCGGFTTFSTVVLEGSAIIGADFPVLALAYAGLTVVLCLGAVVVGLLGGRRIALRGSGRAVPDEEAGA